ncbi:MAG: phosphoribosyltransferase family protein [Candidatus Dependentiae bacterium]
MFNFSLSTCFSYTKNCITQGLQIIAPPFCCYCKVTLNKRNALCDACLQDIKPLVSTTLEITKKYQMRVFCVGAYQEPLKGFILAKGRSDNLACYYMAQLIYHHSLFKHLEIDYIIPIPLHWRRYAKRGYNQSAEIAKYLSKWSGAPIMHVLKRHKATPFQSQCSKEERFENVQDVFNITLNDEQKVALKNKRLLLVDDVMTTGATLISAGKLLRILQPAEINAVVLARTHV